MERVIAWHINLYDINRENIFKYMYSTSLEHAMSQNT